MEESQKAPKPALSERWSKISPELRIRVIHSTENYVVIEKPCNLRSVPGHANPPPPTTPSNPRRTATEAWALAIQTFGKETVQSTDVSRYCLQQLAAMDTQVLQSIPRKFKLFQRYLERNRKRLLLPDMAGMSRQEWETMSNQVFQQISTRQRPLMNLPQPTQHEESAYGQLLLLGHGDNMEKQTGETLKVVHRLDCETSGVMVFAKNELAASFLSKAWREREQVSKHYLAMVSNWPPHNENISSGTIEIPLAPSQERLKWQVSENGKPSTTKWTVWKKQDALVLALQPVTGRTHQLRIHCAHIGSGIVGDSLYGNHLADKSTFLHLHAWKLSFPDPVNEEIREFASLPPWLEGEEIR